MKDFKSVARTIWHHTKVLWKGFKRMVYGAATAGLIALAVYGIMAIPSEHGWTAVCDFIATTATMVVALSAMYAQGAGYKKGARR